MVFPSRLILPRKSSPILIDFSYAPISFQKATMSRFCIRCTWITRLRGKGGQTLSPTESRHPQKSTGFVLAFQNNSKAILLRPGLYVPRCSAKSRSQQAHDLKTALDNAQVYTPGQVQQFVELFLGGADATSLTRILIGVAVYKDTLDEDSRLNSREAKIFCRTYDFLSRLCLVQTGNGEIVDPAQSIITKLPKPKEEDLAKGIIETIDMDSYRVQKRPCRIYRWKIKTRK